MFNRSRRKIILAIMGSLILLFAVTLSVILFASYREIRKENMDMLARHVELYYLDKEPDAADSPAPEPPPQEPQKGKPRLDNKPDYRLSTFYSVAFGEDGTVLISSDLAFDHGRIIETGVTRLRGKIDYTEVGFHFLNDRNAFSLGELQTVFEAVLEEKQDSSNFRRDIRKRYEEKGRIELTDRENGKRRGRPAQLYRLKEE